MDGIDALFNRKDMTFEEAVEYFKNRVPVTASVFYSIAEEYRAFAFTVRAATRRRKSFGGFTKKSSPRWKTGAPSRSSGLI